jgi:hypothetical protein
MVHRFGISMVCQLSCLYCSYFLSIFPLSLFHWSNSYILYSTFYTTFSTCSTVLVKLLGEFFHLSYWSAHFQDLNMIFFKISLSLLNPSFILCILFLTHSAAYLNFFWVHWAICILLEFIWEFINIFLILLVILIVLLSTLIEISPD